MKITYPLREGAEVVGSAEPAMVAPLVRRRGFGGVIEACSARCGGQSCTPVLRCVRIRAVHAERMMAAGPRSAELDEQLHRREATDARELSDRRARRRDAPRAREGR